MKTPFETATKGAIFGRAFDESGRVKASLAAFSKNSGGTIHRSGFNMEWMAERVTEAFPHITGFRARVLAYGAVLQSGRVVTLRRVAIRRPGGFPDRILCPATGWL